MFCYYDIGLHSKLDMTGPVQYYRVEWHMVFNSVAGQTDSGYEWWDKDPKTVEYDWMRLDRR